MIVHHYPKQYCFIWFWTWAKPQEATGFCCFVFIIFLFVSASFAGSDYLQRAYSWSALLAPMKCEASSDWVASEQGFTLVCSITLWRRGMFCFLDGHSFGYENESRFHLTPTLKIETFEWYSVRCLDISLARSNKLYIRYTSLQVCWLGLLPCQEFLSQANRLMQLSYVCCRSTLVR